MAESPDNPPQNPDFDGVPLAKDLLRTIRAGALATLDRSHGGPFSTLVTVATDRDGSPLLLTSKLSGHTKNLEADPRASLLLARAGKGDPLAHPRLTVIGQFSRSTDEIVKARFLARNPKAELYAGFGDFSFWRMSVSGAHLNGGFARAATIGKDELLTDLSGAEALGESEAGAVAHMNEDHREALALYATRLCRMPDGNWLATGIDPEGIDIAANDLSARLAFPARVTDPGGLRRVLKDLADQARAEAA